MSNSTDRDHQAIFRFPWWYPHPFALFLAAAFFAASLTPSMIPRDPVMQGALGGVVAAIGYEIGNFTQWFWRFMQLPTPPGAADRWVGFLFIMAGLVLIAVCLLQAADWQNATRALAGVEPVSTAHPFRVLGAGLAVFLALWLALRLIGILVMRATRAMMRVLPERMSVVISTALIAFLVWSILDGVLLRRLFEAANASFEAADALFEPEFPQPTDPLKTGSDASLVRWEDLGRRGREFIARAPTAEEIAEFHPDGAMDPVRVYVGMRSAETPRARAELALQELIRVGGFERSALVVMVPVGTGWMDPGGQDTLDFILGGDVATVAVQYSYLTSFLSIAANAEVGYEQSRAVFDVIYDYWTALPPDTRPKLYLHGLSQGALNSQITIPLLDVLADPINGALWAGSPFISPFWQFVRTGRNPESPAWRPTYGNGSLVRVMNQDGFGEAAFADWGPMRFVMLHYGSDAIVEFNLGSAFRRPAWMDPPRAPDVPEQLQWYPVVTMFQLAMDMATALYTPRFGHYYVYQDYIPAWAAVLDPPGWSPEREAELIAIFDKRPPAF